MFKTSEHDELMDMFERTFCSSKSKPRREPRDLWKRGNIYCDGHLNQLFLAYRSGYAYGKCCFQEQSSDYDENI